MITGQKGRIIVKVTFSMMTMLHTRDLRKFVKQTTKAIEKNPNFDTYNYSFDYNDSKKIAEFSKNPLKNIKNFISTYKEVFKSLNS